MDTSKKHSVKQLENAISYVAIYVYCDEPTREEVQRVTGYAGEKNHLPKVGYKWLWDGPWNHYDDPAKSVRDFLSKDYPKMQPGLSKLQKEYDAEVEMHLVIGIAEAAKTGVWPDINLDPITLGILSKNSIQLNIYLESQMS